MTAAFDHETVLSLTYTTRERARRVERALSPEVPDLADDRSRTAIDREATDLDLTIQARDLVALRAALNTWLSLLSVAEEAGLEQPGGAQAPGEAGGTPTRHNNQQ